MKVQVYDYQLGEGDTVSVVSDTLRLMCRLAIVGRNSLNIILLARRLTAKAPENDKISEAKYIFNFVRDHIKYMNDPVGHEMMIEPDKLLKIRQGDCDDKSILLSALLLSLGIQTRFVAIQRPYKNTFSHVYVEGFIGGKWIPMDATVKGNRFGVAPESVKKLIAYPLMFNEEYTKPVNGLVKTYEVGENELKTLGEYMRVNNPEQDIDYIDIPEIGDYNDIANNLMNGLYNVLDKVKGLGIVADNIQSQIPKSTKDAVDKTKKAKETYNFAKWVQSPLTLGLLTGVGLLTFAFVFLYKKGE